MLLTVSKRLEFSASRRLFIPGWSQEQNLAAFGEETNASYGTGRNYVTWFVFTGRVDADNGMLMNISEIKRRAGAVIDDRYDHKFLNEDNDAFAATPPSVENIARQLLADVSPLFADSGARLVACFVAESKERNAACYSDGVCEGHQWFSFSAARQTMSPHLSAAENEQLFGAAASPMGHGHNYRARLSFRAVPVAHCDIAAVLSSLESELDHKNLNAEVPGLRGRPITTESLASYIAERVQSSLPVAQVRLYERDDFFAEHHCNGARALGMQMAFSAAHQLHSDALSPEQNASLYGKCNNVRGHGHLYISEATIGGAYNERTGTLYHFVRLQQAIRGAIEPWQNKHLDFETEEFRHMPSTGENIVQALWPKVNTRVEDRLVRLRLWETANNRFTLRKHVGTGA